MRDLIPIFSLLICASWFSCGTPDCSCTDRADIDRQNDSLIHILQTRPETWESWRQHGEPVLFQRDTESYRFSYHHLLAGEYKSYRVEHSGTRYLLYTNERLVRVSDDSSISAGVRPVREADWTAIKSGFRDNCFWNTPVMPEQDRMVLDGSMFLLEARTPGGAPCTGKTYHAVYRRRLEDNGALRAIAQKFLDLEPEQ